MSKRPSLSVFFPAWNEEAYVERTVSLAKEVLERLSDDWEIIVVNDASTDRTQELAEAMAKADPRIRCITHEVNLKLGGAMKTGFSASTKDIVVYSDMDLPFDLTELERALRLMDYLEADMICAFRFDRTSEGPKRILYSFVYNLLIRQLFDVHVKDINFSFKVVHRRVLESLELKSQGSFIDAELVVKALKKGFRVFQMGVDYFPRTRGVSTLASPQVIATMLRELGSLYGDVKHPSDPVRPVRLPESVKPIDAVRKAVGGR
jgi:glycosyltransferase involved in cell wall biosynthesis